MWRSKNFKVVKFIVNSLWRRPRHIHLAILAGILIFIYYETRNGFTERGATTTFAKIEQFEQVQFEKKDDIVKSAELKQNFDNEKNIQRNINRANLLKIDDEIKNAKDMHEEKSQEKKSQKNQLPNIDFEKSNNFHKPNLVKHELFKKTKHFEKHEIKEPVISNDSKELEKKLREKGEIFDIQNDFNKKEAEIPNKSKSQINRVVPPEGADFEHMRNIADTPKELAIPKKSENVDNPFEAAHQNIEKANNFIENGLNPPPDRDDTQNAQQIELKKRKSDAKLLRLQNDVKVPDNQQINDQPPADFQLDAKKMENALKFDENPESNKPKEKKKPKPPKETPQQMAERFLRESKKCYDLKIQDKNLVLLDDIMKAPPQPDNNIFFHDTTCSGNGRINFNMRYLIAGLIKIQAKR